jgi:hypothetical protein
MGDMLEYWRSVGEKNRLEIAAPDRFAAVAAPAVHIEVDFGVAG